MCSSDIFLGLIAILFPPLPVWVKTGLCSADSLINILLCMLGFLPGLLHAWYIIAKYPDLTDGEYASLSQDAESGRSHSHQRGDRVTYVVVQGPHVGNDRSTVKDGQRGYGTVPQPRVHQATDGSWGVGGQVGGVVNNGSASANANGEGSAAAPPPPSYAQAVKGDHKVQSNE